MILQALRLFLLLSIITGFVYPIFITTGAQLLMPNRSNGQLVTKNGVVIGSKLIGQKFHKPGYFWPRPSAIDYNASLSGGSNLGPTSAKLKSDIEERKKAYGVGDVPSELLYASGSGLDPHITLGAALFQVERVAKARGINPESLVTLVNEFAHLGYVNVLLLNQELEERK